MALENTNTPSLPDELLTGDELCRKLKVKQSFLYAPARRKGPDPIPSLRIGKYLRYDLHAVKNWIARQNQGENNGKESK